MRRALSLAFLALAVACGRKVPKPETLADEWQVHRAAGKDTGYLHRRVVRRGEIVATTTESVAFTRDTFRVQTIEIEESATDGTLLLLRVNEKRSASASETSLRFDGTKAILSVRVMGQTRESAIEVPAGLLGPQGIERRVLDTGLKPGAKVEAKTFHHDYGLVTLAIAVVGPEEVELLDGSKDRLVRLETTFEGVPRTRIAWVDAQGGPRRTAVEAHGLTWETHVTTEERAKRGLGAPPPGLFSMEYLPVPHPIPSPLRLDRATYRIRAAGDVMALVDERQSIERAADGSILLRIERKVPPEGRTGQRPLKDPPAEVAATLASSSMVQCDAPEIVALAREIAGSEPDAWKTACALERWVEGSVPYDMEVDLASALEVARDRHGDCTEHAVLLCALCRAAGIPARCTRGLLFSDGSWGRHMWTEVWIEGRWYALDGTLGWGSVGPSHLALARRTFEDAAFPENTIDRAPDVVEIDAVEVVLNGLTFRAGEDPSRVNGDRYENPVWGIGFPCPAGWTFRTPGPDDGVISRIARVESAAGDTIHVGALSTVGDDSEHMRAAATAEEGGYESRMLNGRPALAARKGRRVYVLGTKGAFVFDLAGKTADQEAFDAFLARVDLDGP